MAEEKPQRTSTEVARRTPTQEVLATITSDAFLEKLAAALPEDVTPKRFVSVTVTAIRRTPELITAEPESLYTSVLRCAQDGLMPDGREAALVIFKENNVPKVQYLPMIGGIRKVAADDGFTLNAHVVYANDQFDYALGAQPYVRHKPPKLGEDRGDPIGAYATATDAAGQMVADPEVMDVAQIEHVRSKSKQKDGFAWRNDWPEMARKTVARRLFKSLPRGRQTSERVDRVIRAVDEEFEFPPDGPQMTEAQANATASASTLGQPIGEQKLRDEPQPEGPSDAQLNRIAELLTKLDDDRLARTTLKGVFGVDEPAKLTSEEADRYERTLSEFVEPSEPVEGEVVEEEKQASFEELVPPEVKKQQRRRRAT